MAAPVPLEIRFNGLLVRPRKVDTLPTVIAVHDESGRVTGSFDTGCVEVRLLFDAAGWQKVGTAVMRSLEKKPRRKK